MIQWTSENRTFGLSQTSDNQTKPVWNWFPVWQTKQFCSDFRQCQNLNCLATEPNLSCPKSESSDFGRWLYFIVILWKLFSVSTSEPLAAPSGYKVLVTAMEIGLVRDVVDRVLMTHDYLLSRHNVVGKAYNACIVSVVTGLNVADSVVKTTEEIYSETFPSCELQFRSVRDY